MNKCRHILKRCVDLMGPSSIFSVNPVDPVTFHDYYKIVQKPIFLGQIGDKLDQGVYTSPHEFADDMRQHWYNIKLYNPEGDSFRKLGEMVSPGGTAALRHIMVRE